MTDEVLLDLFGEVPPGGAQRAPGRGPQGGKRYTAPRGYVAQPGSGPAGETCGSCQHMTGRGGRFRKCRLASSAWTHGPGSDVLARSPACSKWMENPKP